MPLKTRGSVKVPYSKSSCSRPILYNQLIKYSLFLAPLWELLNREERTLTTLRCAAFVELT